MDFIKRFWSWLGESTNHNALMVVITGAAVVLAFPYFSKQINNIQIRVESLQESIESMYGHFVRESFCSELKDSFSKNDKGENIVSIRLSRVPVPNSISIWEGIVSIPPAYFSVHENIIETETHWSPEVIERECQNNGIGSFIVTYIPARI